MSRTPPAATALLALLVALLCACAPTALAQGGMAECTAQVDVAQDGHAGPLPVEAGRYRITLLDSARMTCAEATEQFRRFRAAGEKPLPDPWEVKARSQHLQRRPRRSRLPGRACSPTRTAAASRGTASRRTSSSGCRSSSWA